MYKHWHISHINQLSAVETDIFMSSMETLENEALSIELKECALETIERQFDLNLKVYSLPALVKIALSKSPLAGQTIFMVQNICRQSGNETAISFAHDLKFKSREKLTNQLEDYQIDDDGQAQFLESDYIELIHRIDQVIAFSILQNLTTEEVTNLMERDNDWTRLLEKAMRGRFGRFILTLAADTISRNNISLSGKSPDEMLPFRCVYYAQPDMLYAWLQLKTTQLQPEEYVTIALPYAFDMAAEEQSAHDASAWLFRGRDEAIIKSEEYLNTFRLLWVFSLRSLAIHDAIRKRALPELAKKLTDQWEKQREQSETLTPWIYRKGPKYDKREICFSEYSALEETQTEALKAGLAMPLVSLMVSNLGDTIPDFMINLSLELYDVFAGKGIRSHIEKGFFEFTIYGDNKVRKEKKILYSSAIISLLTYGADTSAQIGKGYYNLSIPKLYYGLLKRKAISIFRGQNAEMSEQERFLHSGASVLACARLAYEEASGTIPVTRGRRLWMEGDRESLAAGVCKIALNDYSAFINESESYSDAKPYDLLSIAVSLAYEHFPELISETVKNNLRMRNWLDESDNLQIGGFRYKEPEILLETYPANRWENVTIVIPSRSSTRWRLILMILTRKLRARWGDMSTRLNEDDRKELEIWSETIRSLYKREEFSRSNRFVSIELLKTLLTTSVFNEEYQIREQSLSDESTISNTDARDVAQAAVETIVDLSRDAVFYQYEVGKVITESEMAQQETLNFLKRVYFLMLLEQSLDKETKEQVLQSPCKRIEKRDTADSRMRLLLWFLHAISPQIKRNTSFRKQLINALNQFREEDCTDLVVTISKEMITTDEETICNSKNSKHWNNYWDPDTYQCAQRTEKNLKINVPAKKTELGWIPQERNYIAFLLEQAYSHETVKATLIEDNDKSILVSTEPGCNYRLPAEYWNPGLFDNLHAEIDRLSEEYGTTSYGLRLDLSVAETDGIPLVRFERIDAANLEYRTLFQADDTLDRQAIQELRTNYPVLKFQFNDGVEHFRLADKGWDMISRREGTVFLARDSDWKTLKYDAREQEAEVIRRLLNRRSGDIFKLDSISPCRDSEGKTLSLMAFTTEGIKLRVDSDSVALDHYAIQDSVKNVDAIISVVPNNDYNAPPNGVICQINFATEQAKVKFLDGDRVEIKDINLNELDVQKAYCGLPVHVENGQVRCAQYLPKRKQAKTMTARRLWRMEDKDGRATIDQRRHQVYIGEYYLSDRESPVYLVQDYLVGKLLAFKKPLSGSPDSICGIRGNSFKVSATSFKRPDDIVIIECRQNNRSYYGEAKNGLFPPRSIVSCENVSVQLQECRDSKTGDTLYDIHRVFSDPILDAKQIANAVSGNAAVVPTQGARLARQYYDDYQAWIATDSRWKGHAEGKIICTEGGLKFQPERPLRYLPVDQSDPSIDDPGKWLHCIPVCPAGFEVPQRFKQSGSREMPAYALIRWAESVSAYPNEAEPFNLELFRKWLNQNYPNSQEYDACPLFFRNFENGKVFFDWGIGYRLAVDSNCFIVDHYHNPESQFFYGDRIKKYRLIRRSIQAIEPLCLKVTSIDDCEFSFEHLIREQFCDREEKPNKRKPFIKFHVDPERDTVTTQSITLSKAQNKLDEDNPEWSIVPYHTGILDAEAEKLARERFPNGGDGYMLAKPQWDSSVLRMRYSLAQASPGDILCLMGGEIHQFPEGNDYYIPFSSPFPQSEPISDDSSVTEVRVLRRSFSYRESTLRVYFTQENKSAFLHRPMRVKLMENNGRMTGIINTLAAKPAKNVKEWLKLGKRPQYVVIGPNDSFSADQVRAEIRPGIFCLAKKRNGIFAFGGTGKLFIENDEVCIDAVSDSDSRFSIPGRTVELLIKSQRVLNNPDATHFTVAGLPQIQLRNQRLGQQLIQYWPPRYGVMGENRHVDSCPKNPPFGYLKITNAGGNDLISLFMWRNTEAERYTPFHKISFYDGSVSNLRSHILRGHWHYHDQTTWVSQERGDVQYHYSQDSNLPVLFAKGRSLRYTKDELSQFAFPPHELEEFGVPLEQKGLDGYYPVAGRDEDGVFIELLPGRVVRLPLMLLKLGTSADAGVLFRAENLAVGDMVKLATKEVEVGKPLEISIVDVRYGLRSLFCGAAYLNVREWKMGCITLGSTAFYLEYPSLLKAPNPAPKVMCLGTDNTLSVPPSSAFPKSGDLLMLRLDDACNLCAVGFDNVNVIVSDTALAGWNDEFWLRKQLVNTDERTALFCLFGGLLPVCVENADAVGRQVSVFYPQPSAPKPGEVLCAQVIGRTGQCGLLLRVGTRLVLLDMAKLLSVSAELATEIAKQLESRLCTGRTLWIRHCRDEVYETGFDEQNDTDFSVIPLATVDCEYGNGFLCENTCTQEWLWLPVENVARAENATAEGVMSILREFYCSPGSNANPSLIVRRDRSTGFISWLAANSYYQLQFNQLSGGNLEKKITVRVAFELPSNDPKRYFFYLCYERPRGNIYLLKSEKNQNLTGTGSFLVAVCSIKADNRAELIPVDEVRTKLMLSKYLLESLRRGYNQDRQSIELNSEELRSRYRLTITGGERVFELCNRILKFEIENMSHEYDGYISLIEEIKCYLRKWYAENNTMTNMPVCHALALALLLSTTDSVTSDRVYQIIHKNADLYCCEEILLKDWIIDESTHSKYDPRRILERFNFRGISLRDGKTNPDYLGRLTPSQLDDLEQITDIVLRRNRANANTNVSSLALSLRYAIDRRKNRAIMQAWEKCHYCRLLKYGSLSAIINDRETKSWFEGLLSSRLYNVYVQDLKEIMDALPQWVKEVSDEQ